MRREISRVVYPINVFGPLPHRGVRFRLHWKYFLIFDYYLLFIKVSYEGISPGLWIRWMFFIFWLLFIKARVVELFNVLYSLFYTCPTTGGFDISFHGLNRRFISRVVYLFIVLSPTSYGRNFFINLYVFFIFCILFFIK